MKLTIRRWAKGLAFRVRLDPDGAATVRLNA